MSRAALFDSGPERIWSMDALAARGNPDVAAALILGMRYGDYGQDEAAARAFQAVTGSDADNWFDAMLWQEAHPEVVPHASYREIKNELLERIDPEFLRFLGNGRNDPDAMRIRLEEITWGGVVVDGIPSLDNPDLIPAEAADYLLP